MNKTLNRTVDKTMNRIELPEASKTRIISLGGSILFNKGNLDVNYLVSFRNFVKSYLNKNPKIKFVLTIGGGVLARRYISALRKLGVTDEHYLDRIGLEVVNLNALIVLEAFKELAYDKVIKNPFYVPKTRKRILIYAGYKPGFSSDYVAGACAKVHRAKVVFNLTDVRYLYDQDPKKHKAVKKISKICWNDFIKLAGRFESGKHFPFDPVASRLCYKNQIQTIILYGRDLTNVRRAISGKKFEGTIIN